MVTSTENTRLFGSAAGEIALTLPANGCGYESVVMLRCCPNRILPIEMSGTPKTAFTDCVSDKVKPLVAGPTRVPKSTLRFTIQPSNGACSEQYPSATLASLT